MINYSSSEKRVERSLKRISNLIQNGQDYINVMRPSDNPRKSHIRYTISFDVAKGYVEGYRGYVNDKNILVLYYSTKQLREIVFKRDDYTCHYCGEKGDTLDHLIPRCKGGLTVIKNLVCSCSTCNVLKSHIDTHTFKILRERCKEYGFINATLFKHVLKMYEKETGKVVGGLFDKEAFERSLIEAKN